MRFRDFGSSTNDGDYGQEFGHDDQELNILYYANYMHLPFNHFENSQCSAPTTRRKRSLQDVQTKALTRSIDQ